MNEYDIIDLLTRMAGRLPAGYSPIGDDVAAIPSFAWQTRPQVGHARGQDRCPAGDDLEAGGPEGCGDVRERLRLEGSRSPGADGLSGDTA